MKHIHEIRTSARQLLGCALFLLLMSSNTSTYGQNLVAVPKSNDIAAKMLANSNLVIPVEIDFLHNTASTIDPTITINVDNSSAPVLSRITPVDMLRIRVINDSSKLSVPSATTVKKTFYLFIDKAVSIQNDKILYLDVSNETKQLVKIKVTIQPIDKALTLKEYSTDANQLSYVNKVESTNNILTLTGYKSWDLDTEPAMIKRTLSLAKGEVLGITEWSWLANYFHWQPLPLSLTTIPYKVRSEVTATNLNRTDKQSAVVKTFPTNATSGLNNIGFNLDIVRYKVDRYFSSGTKASHKFSLGIWAGPSVEELDSLTTFEKGTALGKDVKKLEKSKQLFISTGLTLSYSYNGISLLFVPIGFDFATTPVGKTWIYNRQRWWGFGIGVSPTIFATILNK